MNIAYDFHIHSCLSPCGEEEMTPYNIVAMAKLLGLDVIALTDHNTVGNCQAIMKAGQEAGLLVIPGMELCTSEEVHMVCLFPHLMGAEAFGRAVESKTPFVANRPDIFGEQIYMDHQDNRLGTEERLLITASSISVDKAPRLCREHGGICYPAHIDRSSNSILSNLGLIDPSMDISLVELADANKLEGLVIKHPIINEKRVLYSSDAHRLESLAQAEHQRIKVDRYSIGGVLDALRSEQ